MSLSADRRNGYGELTETVVGSTLQPTVRQVLLSAGLGVPGLGEDRLHRLRFVHFAALWAADQRHQLIAPSVAEGRQPVLRKVSPGGQRALQFLSHQLQRVGLKGVPVGHHTSLTGPVRPMRHAHRMTQTE